MAKKSKQPLWVRKCEKALKKGNSRYEGDKLNVSVQKNLQVVL